MNELRRETFRYFVAGAFAICGTGLVVCANRAESMRVFGRSAELWNRGAGAFGIGMLAVLAVTLALVVEAILRFIFGWQPPKVRFGMRTSLIAITLFALLFGLLGILVRQNRHSPRNTVIQESQLS